MPRRTKPPQEDILLNTEPLALPAPRVVHKHDHEIDPYQTPVGAVPAKISNLEETRKPINRRLTKEELKAREQAQIEMRERGARYNRYLDIMTANGGNQLLALAEVYNISVENAQLRMPELLAEVRSGVGSTELAKVLEANDLSLAARANILRKHMYSNNPAASLKAVDMISEMEGDRGETGSFESFLRLAKLQGKG